MRFSIIAIMAAGAFAAPAPHRRVAPTPSAPLPPFGTGGFPSGFPFPTGGFPAPTGGFPASGLQRREAHAPAAPLPPFPTGGFPSGIPFPTGGFPAPTGGFPAPTGGFPSGLPDFTPLPAVARR